MAVPLVAREHGLAFVRQLYVTFDPAGLRSDDELFDRGAARAVADAIAAAARVAPPPSEPGLHRLVFAQPHVLRRARVEGRSLSAAAFVSAASLWTERRVRAGVAVTGELRGEHVLGVGELEPKVRAAVEHGLRALIVPASDEAAARAALREGDALAIEAVSSASALLEAALEPVAAARVDPEEAAREARALAAGGWSGYRWPAVRERLARISGTLPAYRLDLRVELLARLGAAQRHVGDPAGSLELLREAEALARSEEGRRAVPDAPLTYLHLQQAMTARQLGRFAEASRAAERSVRVAKKARLRSELVKALGVLGLVALARGRIDRAIAAFGESLEVALAHEPHRTARTHAYLIEAHGAASEAHGAASHGAASAASHGAASEVRIAGAHFDAAMAEIEREPEGPARRSREAWVRTSWGGALVALGRAREAVEALDRPAVHASILEEPLPGLLARRHLGLALARSGASDRGLPLLAASPIAHGRALEPHLAFVAHLNVLFEARERLAAGAWGADIAGRARRALEHVPRHAAALAYLGRPLTATRRLLARDDAP
ncbi:MAG: hypothetical protein M5U28_35905, partial [Sandaracinaceae bacterium]|nr:hypothetical protein [Sandaracinaceae bacterium]